jgi:hypothetical protein
MPWPFDDDEQPPTPNPLDSSQVDTGGVKPPDSVGTTDGESGDGPRLEDREFDSFNLSPLTPQEIRIDFALCCICGGCPARSVRRELKRLCRIGDSAADRIITEAHRLMVDGFEAPKKALRFQSAAWYQQQLINPNCPLELKFKARQSLDTLLGIRDPVKPSDDETEDEAKQAAKIERDEIRKVLEGMPLDQLKALDHAHRSIRDVVKRKSDSADSDGNGKKQPDVKRIGNRESETDTVSVPAPASNGGQNGKRPGLDW